MKIAVTAEKDSLQSLVASDIKHTAFFLIFNTEDQTNYRFIKNLYNRTISGAEIFCSQFLIEQGIDLLICGEFNNNSDQMLMLAGIKIEKKPGIKLTNIIKRYIKKEYNHAD